jgi:hypothetical protein
MRCVFKTCQIVRLQIVTGESVATQFHKFSYAVFGGVLLFETSLAVKAAVTSILLIHKTKRVIEEMDTKRRISMGRTM